MQKHNFKSFTQVFQSKDYGMFKNMEGNRTLILPHLKRLNQSMSEKHLISPIIVNEKMEVIDGQHRLEVCKQLGLPVYFIIAKGYGIAEVQRLNINNNNWTFSTFLDSYCDMEFKEYLIVKEFKDNFGFDDSTTVYLLAGVHNSDIWNDFKEGRFKVKNYKRAVSIAEKIQDFATYYKGYKRIRFVKALIKVMESPNYEHATMMSKMKYLSTRLVDCVDIDSYEKLLREIYNYRSRQKPI